MSIGVIEPHLYAGYSGGAKTVAIGLAGRKTIDATHSIEFLDNPRTKIGSVKDNPFQDVLAEISGRVSIGFSINVVNDVDGQPAALFCGKVEDIFKAGVKYSDAIFRVSVSQQADIVVCGIGHPKDVNLYQASRAINYIVNVERPVLKKGGVLIIAADLKDGPGTSRAERECYRILKDMRSPGDFIQKVRKCGCVAGEHRAYMIARPLLDYTIIFVTRGHKDIMRGLPFRSFANMDGALNYANELSGDKSTIYVVPRALSTIAAATKG